IAGTGLGHRFRCGRVPDGAGCDDAGDRRHGTPVAEGQMTEILLASAIAVLTACGLYLTFQRRSFPVILGTTLLSYAVNLFLFASGRLVSGRPPIAGLDTPTDPIPQALVLTAIV